MSVRAALRVTVAYAGPEGEALINVDVPAGATVREAVERSGLIDRFGLPAAMLSYAIYGQRAPPATPLRCGDRIELLRPLDADPRDARRRNAAEKPLPRRRPPRRRPRTTPERL